jgi:hypothetical protein
MAKPSKHPHDAARQALRNFGLTYPEAGLKRPWPEHLDLVVRGKTFAFMNVEGMPLKISCKLPRSRSEATAHPFASPTGYGLGKSGWVSAAFEPKSEPPVALLKQWIDESYRSQAPKSLVKQLEANAPASPAIAKAARKTKAAPKAKAAPKKAKSKSRAKSKPARSKVTN